MTTEPLVLRNADPTSDVELHDEIKCRAYELFRGKTNGCNINDGLQAELPRVAYAVAELEKYAKGEVGDTREVRAARVYLLALCSFLEKSAGEYNS